jgi:hypothetical protein
MEKNTRAEVLFMIDIEADGPIPGPYSMNSFGIVATVVRSKTETQYLDVTDKNLQFYSELKPISEKFIPEAIAVGGFDHDELQRTGKDVQVAMTEAATWINETTRKVGGTVPVFAAYPLGFDWLFFYWYLVSFSETGSPFGHGRHLDAKTLYSEKAHAIIADSVKAKMPKKLFSKLPHTHNALDDAIEQGMLLQNLLKWDGQR